MSNSSFQPFPLPYFDVRDTYLSTHWTLVLKGNSSPPVIPIFARTENISGAVVDEQGRWGDHEWSLLPQKYDPQSPWLSHIPIHVDNHHFTRSTIHRSTIVQVPRPEQEGGLRVKEPMMFTAVPDLRNTIREYSKATIALAESAMDEARNDAHLFGSAEIVWPQETINRVTHLWRRLVVGVTSINSFKRALSGLRRTILELEGFVIWASLMRALPEGRSQLAGKVQAEKRVIWRGAFLEGSRDDWLDEQSVLRRIYAHLSLCGAPIYALVRKADWHLQRYTALRIGQAPFLAGSAINGACTRCKCNASNLGFSYRQGEAPITLLLLPSTSRDNFV